MPFEVIPGKTATHEARARIFGEESKPGRSSLGMRNFWQKVKTFKNNFSDSILDSPAEVQILNKTMMGVGADRLLII